ncbi:MAG: helix-turn-helix domain-containing protein, partial [Chloroflexota bacterium]
DWDINPDEVPFMYIKFDDEIARSYNSYPHRHDFYEILYVTAGNGTHFIDFHAHPVEPNTFYFISPGQVHHWETAGEQLKGDVLLFPEDFLMLAPADFMVLHELSFFHSFEENSALRLSQAEHGLIVPWLDAISSEYKTPMYRSQSVLRAHLHVLLVYVQRICAAQNNRTRNGRDTPAQKLVRRFKQMVIQQFKTEQSVSVYAEQLDVTVKRLSNSVKSVTGQTPAQLIRQEIVIEAKRLFAYTEMTAAEVGYRLGFDDPSYFSRFFQRETGVSTMEFRRTLLEKY